MPEYGKIIITAAWFLGILILRLYMDCELKEKFKPHFIAGMVVSFIPFVSDILMSLLYAILPSVSSIDNRSFFFELGIRLLYALLPIVVSSAINWLRFEIYWKKTEPERLEKQREEEAAKKRASQNAEKAIKIRERMKALEKYQMNILPFLIELEAIGLPDDAFRESVNRVQEWKKGLDDESEDLNTDAIYLNMPERLSLWGEEPQYREFF